MSSYASAKPAVLADTFIVKSVPPPPPKLYNRNILDIFWKLNPIILMKIGWVNIPLIPLTHYSIDWPKSYFLNFLNQFFIFYFLLLFVKRHDDVQKRFRKCAIQPFIIKESHRILRNKLKRKLNFVDITNLRSKTKSNDNFGRLKIFGIELVPK